MIDSPATILIIDDDEIKRYTLGRTLRQAGYQIVEEISGQDGLDRAARRPQPDLILLDVRLPDIDGHEVCRRLKANARTSMIPILQTSATLVDSDDRVSGLDSGADAYLVDQTRPREWIATVRALLRVRRAEERLRDRSDRLKLLSEVSSNLLLHDDPEPLLPDLYRSLCEHLNVDVALHFAADEKRRELRLTASHGLTDVEADRAGGMKYGEAICGRVAVSREPIFLESIDTATPGPAVLPTSNLKAYVAYPLISEAILVGTVAFGRRHRDRFDDDEQALLRTVCDHIATAIERKRLRDELQARNWQLAEADRRKDEFLAMLGHELRNPLATITNAIQLLRLTPEPNETAQAIDVADRQVGHLARLVDDLLDVTRITHGKIRLKLEPMDYCAIIRTAVKSVEPLITNLGHQVSVNLPEEPLMIAADATRMEQIIVNLLTNAAKYTDANGRIELELTRQNDRARLTIRDNGIGIDGEQLPKLFVLFNQVSQSLDRSRGGLGIGLMLVRNLVELHGGQVSAQSDGLTQGSTFTVDVPVLEDLKACPAPVKTESTVRTWKILIVDDNAAAAVLLAMLLRTAGHQVDVVHDGLAAVETAISTRPDVILLDIGLPKLDGFGVAARVRAEPTLAHTKLIAISGYALDEREGSSSKAAFDYYLVKPVHHQQLRQILQSLVIA